MPLQQHLTLPMATDISLTQTPMHRSHTLVSTLPVRGIRLLVVDALCEGSAGPQDLQ